MNVRFKVTNKGEVAIALAVKLARDRDFRNRTRDHVVGRMKVVRKFLDSKWYGAQAGLAFERMWRASMHGR